MTDNNGYSHDNGGLENGYSNGDYTNKTNGTHENGNGVLSPQKSFEQEKRDSEQAERDKEPLFYCKWVTARPGLFFGKLSLFDTDSCHCVVEHRLTTSLRSTVETCFPYTEGFRIFTKSQNKCFSCAVDSISLHFLCVDKELTLYRGCGYYYNHYDSYRNSC